MDGRLTPDELELTKATHRHAQEALLAHYRATRVETLRAFVGRCYRHVEALRDDPEATWSVYLTTTRVEESTGRLQGWHFQRVPTGQVEIAPDDDLQPEFLATCDDIDTAVFVTAFNELLTAIARFATRMPPTFTQQGG